ncbi:MAG: protein-disulfide reductase DsbD, partial [Gammaproteobacteria bacterium]|nr:protein-disulfide reductase DsbD [Gammaproteobacteria bacterium]
MHRRFLSLLLLLLTPLAAQAEQSFLKPDEAFVISASADDSDTVRFNWEVADGYYLYQSKFRFISETPGVALGEPDLPPAETKNDPIFGQVSIYRGEVTVEVPIVKLPTGAEILKLKARSQGCADDGICYPPHTQTVLVAISQAADQPPPVDPGMVEDFAPTGSDTGAAVSDSPNLDTPPAEPAFEQAFEPIQAAGANPLDELAALGNSLGLGFEDDILAPEDAFRVSALSPDGSRLQVQWTIADGTYLYYDKVKLELRGDGVQLGAFDMPAPDVKKDSVKPDGSIGDVEVYHRAIDLDIPLVRSNTGATEVELLASYQGCADRGICYPPQQNTFKIGLPAAAGATDTPAAQVVATTPVTGGASAPATPAGAVTQSEQDQIAGLLAGGDYLLIIASFFGIGLLLAFTPCVFPMIPILSGIIAGHGSSITTRKAFTLSLVYVLAMAATYTLAGILVGLFSVNLSTTLQQPLWLIAFAAIFIALAMSMFGFFELQLPSALQSRLTEISNRQKGGQYTGVAIMGLLSALIVGPCLAPPLAGALIFISQTGDAVLGGAALFAMGMGMGVPLLMIGASAGKMLPRAGAWMDAVKAVFGVLMLGIALTMLERLVPTYISEMIILLAWGLLLIGSGIYMGALEPLARETSGWSRLWKGLGLGAVIYGATFLLGAALGGKDTIQPLRGVFGGTVATAQASHATFKKIKSVSDLERELAQAAKTGKPVMLDFYADWCTYCKQMERETFSDPTVSNLMSGMVLLQADVTRQDEADKALQQHIGIPAPPAMIFWSADGNELKHLRLLGF